VEDERTSQVRQYILRQIERDQNKLAMLFPSLDWVERVRWTADTFIPRIVASAERLLRYVESSLNSPAAVRAMWRAVREQLEDERLIAAMNNALEQEARLLSVITGDTVSKLIADFLCEQYPDLAQNNRSTYPDLYFAMADYSSLPKRKRGLATGPALRGGRPTSVPDGIEIKSNRGTRIRVDSHHDHQGLHMALTFDYEADGWRAHDLYLAYLAKADYKRAERNTTATTEKFSFGQAPFISVMTGQVETGFLEELI
jgi:hypothetical protein